MRRFAKKPKILTDKVKLADLILKNWTKIRYSKSPTGYHWHGIFDNNDGLRIDIYFQLYVRRLGVDFVHLHWNREKHPEFKGKALSVGDIKPLLKRFEISG